jgi:hypothetical protein
VGRPQELSKVEKEALITFDHSEFNYPMRKRDLQVLVQMYMVENNIETRWLEHIIIYNT